jgi:hypothetical protein
MLVNMGRARAQTVDAFTAVMGTRRGINKKGVALARGLQAVVDGEIEIALEVIDQGLGEVESEGELAAALAPVIIKEMLAISRDSLTRAGLLRRALDGSQPEPFEFLGGETTLEAAVTEALTKGCGQRRGAEALKATCESEIADSVHAAGSRYLRRGGAAQLRKYFGAVTYHNMRLSVSRATDIHWKSRAISPLLVEAVDGGFIACVCRTQEEKELQSQYLIEAAVRAHTRKLVCARQGLFR